MTHPTRARRSALALLATPLACITFCGAVAEDKPAPTTAKSDKQSSKKYDLRYKLKRGDVLRYDVTHRASIRSTIEQETQAAQTRTDSVKAWKVTDVLKNGEIEFLNVV